MRRQLVIALAAGTFTQSADTFIRDMAFAFLDNTLNGDEVFAGTRVQLLLSR